MSRKFVTATALIMAIGFLLLGVVFKIAAEQHQGVSVSTGITVNGQFVETSSGKIGANDKRYQSFSTGGTIFYFLAGILGTISIVMVVIQQKSK